MKLIPLTRGLFTKVDDEDFDFLSQWKWYAKLNAKSGKFMAARTSYSCNGTKQRTILMHRLLMGVSDPNDEVDHKDVDPLNNQKKSNLRFASHAENMRNSRHRTNTSGFIGVTWHKATKKWAAQLQVNGKMIHVGLFKEKWRAALNRDYAAIEHHGEFAVLNLPFVC